MEGRSELSPATTLGQYEIQKWIGAGGMGDVYAALHKGLNRTVAIKTLQRRFLDDETIVARFLREGQLATRIRHPNIVDISDVGMIGGIPCLVMELLEGESLSAVIRRGGAMPIQELVDLVVPIIGAVEAAHEHGVLHRDLKPSNIFLARAWNGELVPKILDFGISKSVHDSGDASLTTDSAFVGTPHYASPELMQGDRSADARSDQYAIGVVLYEGATGAKPFASVGDNFVTLALAACAGSFPSPRSLKSDIPAAFEAVVLRAMALRRKERFTTMRALGEALLPFASERTRLMWAPTFAKPSARDVAALSDNTAITSIVEGLQVRTGNLPIVASVTPPPMMDGSQSLGGGSAIEKIDRPARGRPSNAILGILAALVVGSILASVAVVKITRSTSTIATASAAPSVSAQQPMAFGLSVEVTPPEATIELDGTPVGKSGRLTQSFPRDGRKHVLRVWAPGHETVLVEFDDTRPPPAQIALRPALATSPPPPTTPAARPGPAPHATGKTNAKTSDGRPRTDNINPWE